jgi:hypothetical protein
MNPNNDPLAIFPEAFRAVVRNSRALALYIGMALVVSTLRIVVTQALTGGKPPEDPGLTLRLFDFGGDLVIAVTWAFAQSVAFSWFGQDIDRPLWRTKGIKDALVRFFPLWLMLDLLIIVFVSLTNKFMSADPNSTVGQLMLLVFMTMQVIATPIGAAIMFHGELKWSELGQSLAPLGRQAFATVLLVVFSGCVVVIVFFLLLPAIRDYLLLRALIEIPSGFADCVIFAATWYICIMDREAEDADDDFDF